MPQPQVRRRQPTTVREGWRAAHAAAHADDLPGPVCQLNPRWKVLDIVGEPLREHGLAKSDDELRSA
jgi:hypothetical protein